MQDIEDGLRKEIVVWMEGLLEGLGQMQKDAEVGAVWANLDNAEWWRIQQGNLAEILTLAQTKAALSGWKTAEKQLRLRLDWDRVLPQVQAWAEAQAGALVTQVSDETRETIRQAVVEGMQGGAPWREIRDQIEAGTGLSDWRAARIARTEVIRAHAQGAIEGYTESGTVRGLKWLGGQANACPRCRALNGKVVALGQAFYQDTFGDGQPPRHPNCRCAVRPVTVDEARRLPEEHPLRDNRRGSIQELTDAETVTTVGTVRVSGQARRHWRYRHGGQVDFDAMERRIENMLLTRPVTQESTPRGTRMVIREPEDSKHEFAIVLGQGSDGQLEVKTALKRKVPAYARKQ